MSSTFCCALILFSISMTLMGCHGRNELLTPQERKWLNDHDGTIRLAVSPDWEPMEFFDENGQYRGMVADYVRLIEEKLGFKFKIIRPKTWEEVLTLAKKRQIDVMSAAQTTPERQQYMNWSTPYLNLKTTIIVQKSHDKTFTLDHMQGLKIGVPKGYAVGKLIRDYYPELTIIDVATGREGMHKVSFGELFAMIMEVPNALHVIEKEKITNLRLAGDTGFELNLGFGIRSDWPIMARILEKGLADIGENEHQDIYSKWIRLEGPKFYQVRAFWYSIAAATLVMLLITGSILFWNRALKKQVMERTEKFLFNEMRLEALLKLNEQTHTSIRETIEFAFEQMVRLTRSRFGYLAFADQDGIVYSIDPKSKKAIKKKIAQGFTPASMGLWGEAVKQRKPVISNNYRQSNPRQKGLPPGCNKLIRYMNVPIFNGDKVVAVAGMGNKKTDYDKSDLRQIDLLAQGMWRILQRKNSERAIYKSEKNMRDLVENSPNGIEIMQHGKVVYRNSKQLELIGEIKPVDSIKYDHFHTEDQEKVKMFYTGIIQENPTITELDFRFYSSLENKTQETMKWVTCLVTPINFRDDKAFLLTTIDLTRARELEYLLKIQDKMASLGRVAAGIAHEIRNPLSGINIYLRILDKSIGDPQRAHKIEPAIDAIRFASEKIESVIKRVMDFSKPGEPQFDIIDINAPILEAVHLAAMTLGKKNISLETQLDKSLPHCHGEPNLIEEVILNLINNAVDAMEDQNTAKCILVSSATSGDKIIVTVEDTGPGIPEELEMRIFEPFFTTKDYSTGIGLSLCHRIITDHHGTIKMTPADSGGSRFIIELPLNSQGIQNVKSINKEA